MQSDIPQTAAEAKAMGCEQVPRPDFHEPGGKVHEGEKTLGGICYTGPCIAGTVTRTVCYYDDTGRCAECYAVPSHECGA